jgi:O-antigen ligase
MITRFYRQGETWLWILLLLLLPITSLPLLSKAAGGTMVAPASAIPLLLILVFYTLPRLLGGAALPRQVLPLLGFLLAALLATAVGLWLETPLFRQVDRLRNALSALVTLFVGIGFYLAAVTSFSAAGEQKKLFAWLNVSGAIVIIWSAAQFGLWKLQGGYPHWMEQIQNWISVSGNLYDRRATGLAFEPSWLGHQLVMLYLPYWLAATVTGSSAFRFRAGWITAENALLAGGFGVLILSFARSALASFLLSVALFVILMAQKGIQSVQKRIRNARSQAGKPAITARTLTVLIWFVIFVILLAAAVGGLYFLSRFDTRMENLFALLKEPLSFEEMAQKLIFGERVAFWQTGLAVFSDYPITGVGLDSAGFFFIDKMTPQAWSLVEPHKLYYSSDLPNPLSLWVRLLAETGILGFACFVSFLLVMALTAASLLRHPRPEIRTAAYLGTFCLAALLMEGMSVDTFAFPYYWIALGWLTAAYTAAFPAPLKAAPDSPPPAEYSAEAQPAGH